MPDARTVLVNIGKDYYLDMGLDEAHRWIAARDKALTTRLGALNEEATQLQQQIYTVRSMPSNPERVERNDCMILHSQMAQTLSQLRSALPSS